MWWYSSTVHVLGMLDAYYSNENGNKTTTKFLSNI
jgi:hypothetical protein